MVLVHRHVEGEEIVLEDSSVHHLVKEGDDAWLCELRVCKSDDCVEGVMEASFLSHHAEHVVVQDQFIFSIRGTAYDQLVSDKVSFEIPTAKCNLRFSVALRLLKRRICRLFLVKAADP